MTEATPAAPATPPPFDDPSRSDPLEEAVRGRVRALIEQLLEEELEAALGRRRYERAAASNGQALQDPGEHQLVRFQRQPGAGPAQPRMVRHPLIEPEPRGSP